MTLFMLKHISLNKNGTMTLVLQIQRGFNENMEL